jgi:hypothetical protein
MESCPVCGAEIEDGATTCAACGAVVHEVTASFPPVGSDGAVHEHEGIESDGPLLIVRKGPEVGERFYLDRPRLSIGRDPESDIFLNDITVSRCHALLELDADGSVSMSDAGSLNGTYVNGVSVDRAVLRNGDQLQVGRFQMVFLSGGGD